MTDNTKVVRRALEKFIYGEDRSKRFAGELEVLLDRTFHDDARFADLILALASYEPGGGPYLYDENAIVQMAKRALRCLD
jgi:hypothetical protein